MRACPAVFLNEGKPQNAKRKLNLGCDASCATPTPESGNATTVASQATILENLGLPVEGRDLSGKLAEHAIGRIHLPMTEPILRTCDKFSR